MSLLGIDVGTTGCKATVFSETGQPLSFAYEEYDIARPRPGWSELDPVGVWRRVRAAVAPRRRGTPRGTRCGRSPSLPWGRRWSPFPGTARSSAPPSS